MEGHPLISPEVLAKYAADAAKEVDGVAGLTEDALHRGKPVEITGGDDSPTAVIHLDLEWGRSAPEVAGDVQRRVAEYLERMASITFASVDVVVDGIRGPHAKR